jgi:hypothetical protein
MDDREKRLLPALASMAWQYLYHRKHDVLDSNAMDAGRAPFWCSLNTVW